MAQPDLTRFPEFETLPAMAQDRIRGFARRYGIAPQKALMLTMLIAQGVPFQDLLASCRLMGVPITMSKMAEIRQELGRWVSKDQHRQRLMAQLEALGLLTPEVYEQMVAARSKQEMASIYLRVAPFEVLPGENTDAGLFSELSWSSILIGAFLGDPRLPQ